jgi:uncharacterized membrane protein YkvA (DUF1232 family)
VAVDKVRLQGLATEVVTFLPDVAMLFRDLAQDDRVPRWAKVEAALAAGYVMFPIDLVPDFLPGIGQLDDIAIVGWAVRRLLLAAGENVLKEHWRGSPRGLEVLLQLASAGFRPRRAMAAVALGSVFGRSAKSPGEGVVVDGELV